VTAPSDHNVYAGPASLVVAERRHVVRVRLKGFLHPVDGRYHWQGTVHDAPQDVRSGGQPVRLCIGDRDAVARLVERTSYGDLMISGTGHPPFWP
jgi:hypothetical protein